MKIETVMKLKSNKYFRYIILALSIVLIFAFLIVIKSLFYDEGLKYYVINEKIEDDVFLEKKLKNFDNLSNEEISAKIIELISNDESIKELLKPTSEVPGISTFVINEKSAILSFNNEFVFKSPLSLQLYKSCLIKSLCSTGWIDDIIFISRDFDNPGLKPTKFSLDNIITDFEELKTVPVDIYYVTPSGDKLKCETKYYYENYAEDMTSFIMRQISKGPYNGNYSKILPNRYSSYSAHVEDGLCVITFNEEFKQWEDLDNVTPQCFIQSIVNSLCSSPDIDRVKISFSYDVYEEYKGIDISKPFTFDNSLILSNEE